MEYLVKTSLYLEESFTKDFIVKFSRMKDSVIATLIKANESTSENDKFDLFVGQGLHTSNTESFFPESIYSTAAFDDDGNVDFSKFPSYTDGSEGKISTWGCSKAL